MSEKIQSRKVGVAGGFSNQVMGNNKTEPIVGEGATILMYSDREAYFVTEVSECGNRCTIQKANCKYTGSGYGDETYDISPDPEGHPSNLEWNEKQGSWGRYWYSVEIIKALANRLFNEYSYDWQNHLPNGLKSADLYDGPHLDNYYNEKIVIKGVTKRYKNFSPVSIIFGGTPSQYRDPSF